MNQDLSNAPFPSAPSVVLVIDDQERNLRALRLILAHHGFEVITASNAKQALQRLEMVVPDVILLDVMMPELDGFEACRLIKQNKVSHDIPVIFLSAAADHRSIIQAFTCGGVDYITKPFNKAELLARIHTQIELRRTRQQQLIHAAEKEHTLQLIGQDWRQSMEIIVTLASRLEEPNSIGNEWTTKEICSSIKNHSEQMLGSIDEFLSRHVEDGSTEESKVTTSLLKDMAAAWYVTARRRQIEFSISAPHHQVDILADASSVGRIVDAIISNAVNLCAYGGHISVRIVAKEHEVLFSVEDDGPGFPQEYFHRQFQPFPQQISADASPARKGPLGYGLAIAKRAADQCGATITIANQVEGGAKACVIFKTRPKPVPTREFQP